MSGNLQQIEEFMSKHINSAEKLEWTNDLIKAFEESKLKIKTLDRLYIPKPHDQLVMTSDWSKTGFHATLWAVIDDKFLVVARMSGKPIKAMDDMLPCDGEVKTAYLAAKNPIFSLLIKASKHRTISLLDNKTGVQAANLLSKGKFSSSKIINELLTAISELNLEFQHMSGKLGQNFLDDFGSRNPATCPGGDHCKICSFIKNCSGLKITVNSVISFEATSSAVIGSVDLSKTDDSDKFINEIIRGTRNIPFSNRNAMKYLQEKDPDLVRARDYLTSAQRPQTKYTKINSTKRYLQDNTNMTIAKDGCLVVIKSDKRFKKKELIVIPENMSLGLLYSLHWKLNHPTPFQLTKVVDTKFFMLDKDKKIKKVSADCTPCQSVAHIPRHITDFQPNQVPKHPGETFTMDILKLNKKVIAVATENFSGFICTRIVASEKRKGLLEAIIGTVTPFMSSHTSQVRVDQAPAFKSLLGRSADLTDLGIQLEAGEAKNKNALAIVDKKIQELHREIRMCAPANNVINVRILAKATAIVNEKIRGSGLSAKEILFARDQFTMSTVLNLKLLSKLKRSQQTLEKVN